MTMIKKVKGFVPTVAMLIALDESIEHWKRMIAWVKTRSILEKASRDRMLLDIGENWYGDYCPLCKKFGNESCEYCILYKHGIGCDSWYEIDDSVTWEEWLRHANNFLTLMKKIQELYNKGGEVKHMSL